MNNIILIGMPGSGKSTLGRVLATELNMQFVDMDDEIVQVKQMSIEDIFRIEGEKVFRELEASTLQSLVHKQGQIISTGGGTPCFFNNMDIILQNGISIYIDVPTDDLLKRITRGDRSSRPMVQNKTDEEVLDFLNQKLAERKPFYSKATLTFSGNNIQAADILRKLQEI